jgi:hypothetical protein
MSDKTNPLDGLTQAEAVEFAKDNSLADLLANGEVVRERRPAKMVTALRIDLSVQAELEAAATARGIGASTLMRQIIEEWVESQRRGPAPDPVVELVRHLEAARLAADSIARRAA